MTDAEFREYIKLKEAEDAPKRAARRRRRKIEKAIAMPNGTWDFEEEAAMKCEAEEYDRREEEDE